MSLDVYLTANEIKTRTGSGIFVRQDGETREISRQEWESRFPSVEPCVVQIQGESNEVYSANVTHNLNRMADEAGIYDCLWRPDENGITKAKQLIDPLRAGLNLMKSQPERFKKHNPANGWGSYDMFVPWLERYLAACEQWPDATVRVSR